MIKISSPTRVDFAGGTLDCWPLHVFVGDCVTVNLAIDVMTGCELEMTSSPAIEVEVTDLNYRQKFANLEQFLGSGDSQLKLVQGVVKVYRPQSGFKLKTFSQSPVGGGLGGSSSLCISLIKAFAQAEGTQLKVYETVEMAHNIEAEVIHAPTGTQDYFPALASGLNLIHYSARGAQLEPIDFDEELFSTHMMLVYTGKAHHSGINNWQVLKDVIEGNPKPLNALKKIAQISAQMAQACQDQAWGMIPELFHREFEARVELSSGFTSPEIETLRRLVLQCGGDAVKICGAGGGGCVLVWAHPSKHEAIGKECQKNGFRPIKFQAVRQREPVLL